MSPNLSDYPDGCMITETNETILTNHRGCVADTSVEECFQDEIGLTERNNASALGSSKKVTKIMQKYLIKEWR